VTARIIPEHHSSQQRPTARVYARSGWTCNRTRSCTDVFDPEISPKTDIPEWYLFRLSLIVVFPCSFFFSSGINLRLSPWIHKQHGFGFCQPRGDYSRRLLSLWKNVSACSQRHENSSAGCILPLIRRGCNDITDARDLRAPSSPLQLQLMFFLARRSEFIPTQFRWMRRRRPNGANKYGFIEVPPRGKRI